MKIAYLSDLHLEHWLGSMKPNGSNVLRELIEKQDKFDILVLAGDIHSKTYLKSTLDYLDIKIHKPIIYIPGNHEYYGISKEKLDEELVLIENNKLWILNNKSIEFEKDKVVFICGTAWCDGSLGPINYDIKNYINDFKVIPNLKENIIKWGKECRLFFEEKLEFYHKFKPEYKIICVTHNTPSKLSIPQRFLNNSCNAYFTNNWEDLIIKYQPRAWIHGHTHDCFEYNIRETDILCNSCGYPQEKNPKFKPIKILEV